MDSAADRSPGRAELSLTPHLALITGATAGIGAAFARHLAAEGYRLILVARDADRLTKIASELTEEFGVPVEILSADLSTDDGCTLVEERIKGSDLHLLVNSAGISLNRPFLRSTAADETRLLMLNVHAVMRLTLASLSRMVERQSGIVINVSSVAGFAPVMPGSTYSASKAWVTNFSESVGQSVRPFGVRVMALCPGYTRTEFHSRAGIDMSATPGWMWLQAEDVVREALRDLQKEKIISIPSWRYKLAVAVLRYTPRRLLDVIVRDTRGRVSRQPR